MGAEPGKLMVMVPAEALAKLTSTVVEYVLVAVEQRLAVLVALSEQTGATEQEAGAV